MSANETAPTNNADGTVTVADPARVMVLFAARAHSSNTCASWYYTAINDLDARTYANIPAGTVLEYLA